VKTEPKMNIIFKFHPNQVLPEEGHHEGPRSIHRSLFARSSLAGLNPISKFQYSFF
jgi:hypothetical protein